jgi:hypothetical protein
MATDRPRRCPSWCSGDHHYGSMHVSAAGVIAFGEAMKELNL